MTWKSRMAALLLSAVSINSYATPSTVPSQTPAQQAPALAARGDKPQQPQQPQHPVQPVPEPVNYKELLVGILLLLVLFRRNTARAEPWTKD